ncbi:MAG: hypothetical protein JSW11_00130 [Candidatus Heimdallarchaeota archaeon]|nr:MAG: hypothetical protein JSW11_00130 [Candidatus Heimdallarchaeota archaeon]
MRKVRNREKRIDVELMLLKFIPWLFLILLYLAATSLGTAALGGPNGALID